MMASFYCQELIRNTLYLCHGYINKLQQEKVKGASNKKKSSSILANSRDGQPHEPQNAWNSNENMANPNSASEEEDPIIIGKQ